MAEETELITQAIGNGRIDRIQGVSGIGTKGRQVTLEAVPDPGYQFERWVITKTLPFFAAVRGPYNSPDVACGGEGAATGDTYFLYVRGSKLYVDDQGEREAPLGYYQPVSAANGYRPTPNTYIEYTGNFIPTPATCPRPSSPGTGNPANTFI
jgi:hypothetical protein